MSSRRNLRRAPGYPRRNPRKSSVVDGVANATIPAKKVGQWGCLDCSHRSNRADHLIEHMIFQHHREKNDPYFKTLNHTRWETCPGCNQSKSKLSQHKKSCKEFLAKMAPQEGLNRTMAPRDGGSSENSSSPSNSNANPGSNEANKDRTPPVGNESWAKYCCPECAYSTQYGYHLRRHMMTIHKRSKHDAFCRTMGVDGRKPCPKCFQEVTNLIEHRKLCPAWTSKALPVLQILKNSNLEECFRQYLGHTPLSTRSNYERHFRFIQSQHVTQMCDRVVSSSGQNDLDKYAINPTFLRDLTMGLLELTTGGLRGVSIRSLTLKEYQRREVVSEEPFEVSMKCHAHRLARPYDISEVIVKSRIVMEVLSRYVEHSRLLIGDPTVLAKPGSPLFPTMRNRIPCSTKIAIAWVRRVMLKELHIKDDADPELTTLNSSAIRKAFTSNSAGLAEFKQKTGSMQP
ncbi:hypothetical protein TCAL_11781 [Tigriopus californicus]|uniref:C2H2-type domain-containing protein n=1 Tax=Tigriopus californicus TaxID=6832 RepID=A0A553PFC8_TIGCA|nr:hypothetical protein TCAL_11781 [Tigriopus californicus]